ncbi:MAG: 2Fe-2S iron-sulfur cluster-binding protein [Gemmatales bacterium]|nr:2Fe-2S iron-sulfur cluster-binding protein [Gemmatales bacterium]MDW7994314.1 2Fe-2S iron-sulfur cluster-binding protein [Gemmatales bacterium]
MAIITVNGRDIEIGDHESLNLIQAAQRAGVEIPHYCWHPALSVVASCRMCLVEVGEKRSDGSIVMQPRVVPACQTPAKHGTVVVTNSPKARAAQAATLEYLLLNHPLDCPVCDQAGECLLQDYSYKYGRARSRLREGKLAKADKYHIGDQIVLFTDRCVMCTRCVRFTREISGTAELEVIHRGDHAEIDIFPGKPCNNKLAGNVVDICPVGALCSKDFLYKQRVWFLKSQKSVCPQCATGCSIWIDHNKNIVYRLRPRYNPQANGYFMCDEGRFGYHHVNSKERLLQPLGRQSSEWMPLNWLQLVQEIRSRLDEIRQAQEDHLTALVLSPWLTLEEAWLACQWMRQMCPRAKLVRGPIRDLGEDDIYPKTSRGEAVPRDKAKFIIRGEKAPNRCGLDIILRHYETTIVTWTQWLESIAQQNILHVYFINSDPLWEASALELEALRSLRTLVVHDIFPRDWPSVAHWLIPATTFAEKSGTYINADGLAQTVRPAIIPPEGMWSEARFFWQLLDRTGLYHAPTVRREIASTIAALQPLDADELGESGIPIRSCA